MKISDRAGNAVHRGFLAAACPVIVAVIAACVVLTAVAEGQVTDYIINDGDDTITVRTYMDKVENILSENGIDMENAWYVCQEQDGCVLVTIHHNHMITVAYDGKETAALVGEGTVEKALNALDIALNDLDIVSSPLTDEVYEGMKITINRVTIDYTSEELEIGFETEYVDNPEAYEGVDEVLTEGKNGLETVTYKNTYVDGELSATEVANEEVIEEPVNEVIFRGTKEVVYSENLSAEVDADSKTITTESGEVFTYSKVITMKATAYTYHSGQNITYSGVPAQVGVVAALPSTIPQGSRVYIVSPQGTWEYGFATVGDKPARNILDLFMETYNECIQFGVKEALVYILDDVEA